MRIDRHALQLRFQFYQAIHVLNKSDDLFGLGIEKYIAYLHDRVEIMKFLVIPEGIYRRLLA